MQNTQPLIHTPHDSTWAQQFSFVQCKPLIVCRGPIRKEAIDVFETLGTQPCGILLSYKDSIVYPKALAPEVRLLQNDASRIHLISDYMGSTPEEKSAIIEQMLQICHENQYTHVFAGYGFMSEDASFVEALEQANIGFIGPSSAVIHQAGAKDEAKQLARQIQVSVTPGIDDLTTQALLHQAGKSPQDSFQQWIQQHSWKTPKSWDKQTLEEQAQWLLDQSHQSQVDLVSIEALQQEATRQVTQLLQQHPKKRIRLKHIGGGGGKGQRIVSTVEEVPNAVMEVLVESKATAPGSNRNMLIELNIEDTRHNEIQLLGNGQWCVALGGRDCSLQMHEQKLLEFSLTPELLKHAIDDGVAPKVLKQDLKTLEQMCAEAEAFGEAVKLNSASTFECIVDQDQHYFMEMNTRIQVEHRVTEMVYALRFENPKNPKESIEVHSLVAAMLLIARHGEQLPKPQKIPQSSSGLEARLNATNAALQPHAGGVILNWSHPSEMELRDDQGIGLLNPDTQQFIPYHIAGAYDSNVALSVTWGESRMQNLQNMAEVLRTMQLQGEDLQLNQNVHYGLCHWLLAQHPMAKPNTRFMSYYLNAVGALAQKASNLDLERLWKKRVSASSASLKTLILRPLKTLLQDPHQLAGWAAQVSAYGHLKKKHWHWSTHPFRCLENLYAYLNMDPHPSKPASQQIWEQDVSHLTKDEAHAVNDLIAIPFFLAHESQFNQLKVNDDLSLQVPDIFQTSEAADVAHQCLAPPPKAHGNTIVSWTGGTFYSQETPESEPYVQEGEHFEEGQTLGLLEVMKMFNPIRAEFPGTLKKACVDGSQGALVARAQVLFEVEPDYQMGDESETNDAEHQALYESWDAFVPSGEA